MHLFGLHKSLVSNSLEQANARSFCLNRCLASDGARKMHFDLLPKAVFQVCCWSVSCLFVHLGRIGVRHSTTHNPAWSLVPGRCS